MSHRLTLASLRHLYAQAAPLTLDEADRERVQASCALVDRIVAKGDAAYGINTGFGLLAQTRIPADQLEALQRNLVLSHAVGVGAPLADPALDFRGKGGGSRARATRRLPHDPLSNGSQACAPRPRSSSRSSPSPSSAPAAAAARAVEAVEAATRPRTSPRSDSPRRT